MEQIIQEMLNEKKWAVVGAHPKPEKYGYKIFKKLLAHDYQATAINPVYDMIDGHKTYGSLRDLEDKPTCVNVVVNPERAKKVVEEVIDLGIEYIWFQPGAFNEEVIDMAEAGGLKVVYHACVLVELDR